MSTSPQLPTITITSSNQAQASSMPSTEKLLLAPKRSRESLCHSEEGIGKTPRLSNYDSPHRIVQLIDRRFEKQTELIKELIQQSESRLLTVIDNSMGMFKREIAKVNERITNLYQRVESVETVADKIVSTNADVDNLKTEIEFLKSKQQKLDNLQVACDLRINGVPFDENENLFQIFDNLCDTLNISTPTVKSIYRINNNRNNSPDTVIMVNLVSPFDKNYVLKNISTFRKSNKSNLLLKHIGFDSDNPFYVNENLTSHNYKIFQNALKLRKQKHIDTAYTLRGLVYVKLSRTEPPILIECIDQLTQLFRNNPECNNDKS